MKYIIYIFFGVHFISVAQTKSQKTFIFKDFCDIVLKNHPFVRQAGIMVDISKQHVLLSRGAFDLKFDSDVTQKTFKGNRYYGYFDNGLKVPLWFGPDLKLGYETNTGQNLNPADYTPPAGLQYIGMQIPIGPSLLIDERRSILKQSKLVQKMADIEKKKILNKLILSASKEYWEWASLYQKKLNIDESFKLAQQRLQIVKDRVQLGDLAAIDTSEATIAINERILEQQTVELSFKNKGLLLSNYLWDNETPLELEDNIIPENFIFPLMDTIKIDNYISQIENIHPELMKFPLKIKQYEIESKFRKSQLFPDIKLTYKLLSEFGKGFKNLDLEYAQNNNKLFFSIDQPLFLRKERAKYAMSKLKLEQVQVDKLFAVRDIKNTVNTSYNECITNSKIIQNYENIVKAYTKLYEQEVEKLQLGDSPLFLVIAREQKLFESKNKYMDAAYKYMKSYYEFIYNVGGL